MPAATAAPARHRANSAREGLRCRVRLADGRVFTGALAPERHRALQLGILHEQTGGLVELAAGARRDGRLQITTRRRADHFLPGGQAGRSRAGCGRCSRSPRGTPTAARRCSSPRPPGRRRAATSTRSARPASCGSTSTSPTSCRRCGRSSPSARATCSSRAAAAAACTPTGSSTEPLPATRVIESTGELVEPIERAHLRLIHHLGTDADGKPNVADPACAERSRVMRLAGTRQRQDRRARADPRGRPRAARLPDPAARRRPARSRPAGRAARPRRRRRAADPYKRISPREYFERLAGIVVPRDGLVRCPAAGHEDRNPVVLGRDRRRARAGAATPAACGARGAIYDLASVLLGGPWGPELRGEAFRRARAYVVDVFGELPDKPQEPAKE